MNIQPRSTLLPPRRIRSDGPIIAFLLSNEAEERAEFAPFTCFGTFQAAVDRSEVQEVPPSRKGRLYEVEISARSPLLVPEITPEHRTCAALTDLFHYSLNFIGNAERERVLAARREAEEAGLRELASCVRSKGYDSLLYTSLHEDPGSEGWAILHGTQAKILRSVPTRYPRATRKSPILPERKVEIPASELEKTPHLKLVPRGPSSRSR